MTIDFDLEVLTPLIDLDMFGRDITIFPVESQPDAPLSYAARGVWMGDPYTILQENQAPLSTSQLKLGLRIRDFDVPPDQGDHVLIADSKTGKTFEYVLNAPDYDGEGGVQWSLRAVDANQETPFLPLPTTGPVMVDLMALDLEISPAIGAP